MFDVFIIYIINIIIYIIVEKRFIFIECLFRVRLGYRTFLLQN